jgi:acyl-CoA synthetase (AMP-forming)/AMP-acid ligase II
MSFTLANVIREHAASRPGKEALVYGDRRFTYAEVHERSSRAASALRAAGVQPGDRVGLLMKNCSEFYELMVACSKAGRSSSA